MIDEVIIKRVKALCGSDVTVDSNSRIKEDLGVDSLKLVMLITMLCSDYKIPSAKVMGSDILGSNTVGDLGVIFKMHLNQKDSSRGE